jgi:D-sedoheptulose 7-phosphate isomerase
VSTVAGDPGTAAALVAAEVRLRREAGARFFTAEAERLARLCRLMSERFLRGGRLVALAATPAGRSDARHVAVEFVHPVIVGKRALPALALCAEGGPLAAQARLVLGHDDIAIAFGADAAGDRGEAAAAVAVARAGGCLTIGFGGSGAEHEFVPDWRLGEAVRQELVETLYHLLWELVHVFFEHAGRAGGGGGGGASSFLYPFLDAGAERSPEPVVEDVRRSVLMKSAEIGELREQTLTEAAPVLVAAAAALRGCFAEGGKLLALGNGGSATNAADVVADFRSGVAGPSGRPGPGHPALDLTEDSSILTAIANDVGVEAVFLRQVIAYGQPGDALLALSTSGGSANVIAALAEARKRGLRTIALVGYDGGRIAGEALADHVIITRSEHIPRIQEAQASAYHVLRELVG